MILDEADELLSHGFKEQIYKIFQFMNNDIQIGLFSATMPQELSILTSKFLRHPIKILIQKGNEAIEITKIDTIYYKRRLYNCFGIESGHYNLYVAAVKDPDPGG